MRCAFYLLFFFGARSALGTVPLENENEEMDGGGD